MRKLLYGSGHDVGARPMSGCICCGATCFAAGTAAAPLLPRAGCQATGVVRKLALRRQLSQLAPCGHRVVVVLRDFLYNSGRHTFAALRMSGHCCHLKKNSLCGSGCCILPHCRCQVVFVITELNLYQQRWKFCCIVDVEFCLLLGNLLFMPRLSQFAA